MPRPRKRRYIECNPKVTYFKPRGVPVRELEEVILLADEIEAVRLKYIEELDQVDCAEKMGISQSTFQRILSSSNKKIADSIINGKALRLESPLFSSE